MQFSRCFLCLRFSTALCVNIYLYLYLYIYIYKYHGYYRHSTRFICIIIFKIYICLFNTRNSYQSCCNEFFRSLDLSLSHDRMKKVSVCVCFKFSLYSFFFFLLFSIHLLVSSIISLIPEEMMDTIFKRFKEADIATGKGQAFREWVASDLDPLMTPFHTPSLGLFHPQNTNK